jgi:UDP-glucose 4-epimerase
MNLKQKTIYITGVSGFIGSRLAKLCLECGYKVIGIARSLSSRTISQELGIDVIEADLNDKNELVLETAEAIIHCATANDILSKNMNEGLSLSIIGTSKLLKASRIAKISNVIFFSTAQVYGTELNGYFDETSPIDCKSPYGINHHLGEELCKFYCNTQDFNITVLRPSNVYGVPETSTVNRNTLVPMCFVDEAINFKTITLRSSGKQSRNFISIDQLAEVVLKTIKNFPKGFSLRNCGSNFYPSMLEIANIVSKQYQSHYKEKLFINIEGNQPKTSNIFEYGSKFGKNLYTEKKCIIELENVINNLFKLWKKN